MDTTILPLFPFEAPVPPARQLKRMKPVDAAYLAGLLDGEGHFGMEYRAKSGSQRKYYSYYIALVMTDKPLLEQIAVLVPWGNAHVNTKKRTLRGRARPAYIIQWTGHVASSICRAIWPYVRLKRRHVELFMWLDDEKTFAVWENRAKYPAYINEMHARALAEIRVLNKRGQDNEPV